MKPNHHLLAVSAITLTALFAVPALAQSAPASNQTAQAAPPALADGEVRKIDKEQGKITLRHGEIKHLDMPPMTMVFVVKDKSMLHPV